MSRDVSKTNSVSNLLGATKNTLMSGGISKEIERQAANKMKVIQWARDNKASLLDELRTLDPENTGMVTYMIFTQAASDNAIHLDGKSTKYIIKHRCDVFGKINYKSLVRDLIGKFGQDASG